VKLGRARGRSRSGGTTGTTGTTSTTGTTGPIRTVGAIAAAVALLTGCTPIVSGWVPYWDATAGSAAFSNADVAPMFDEVSPFWFSATGPTGTITRVGSESSLNATVEAARAKGLVVLPSITDGTGKGVMAEILADTTPVTGRRAVHIANIVNLVMDRGYDGIDLDYEGFAFDDGRASWETTRPLWIAFVHQLGAELHARNKLLAITIPPTWLVNGVETGYTVYAQGEIADAVDRIRLMVYDYSYSSPGPIAPMSWVEDVIEYSNSKVADRTKLQLGVPTYGRRWGIKKNSNEVCPANALRTSSIQMENTAALIASKGGTPVRDASGEMRFTYTEVATGFTTAPLPAPPFVPPTIRIESVPGSAQSLVPAKRLAPPSTMVSCTVEHRVFYPDAESVRQRTQAALDAGWRGSILWALGYETTDVWIALGPLSQTP
jgi:spore germination protein YaaH